MSSRHRATTSVARPGGRLAGLRCGGGPGRRGHRRPLSRRASARPRPGTPRGAAGPGWSNRAACRPARAAHGCRPSRGADPVRRAPGRARDARGPRRASPARPGTSLSIPRATRSATPRLGSASVLRSATSSAPAERRASTTFNGREPENDFRCRGAVDACEHRAGDADASTHHHRGASRSCRGRGAYRAKTRGAVRVQRPRTEHEFGRVLRRVDQTGAG